MDMSKVQQGGQNQFNIEILHFSVKTSLSIRKDN